MHIELLVEDSSGKRLLESLLPKVLGQWGDPHSWNLHSYMGVGQIPTNLHSSQGARKKMLLSKLPSLLRGYGRTPGIDAVIVFVDSDRNDCVAFLSELKAVLALCDPKPRDTMFRLAIEEVEAWYLGDQNALLAAYPRAKNTVLINYTQDSICGTWENLADAIYPGGAAAVKKQGWPLPGQLKHEWAENIGPHMDVENNVSPSFAKFRDGLRRLTRNSEL